MSAAEAMVIANRLWSRMTAKVAGAAPVLARPYAEAHGCSWGCAGVFGAEHVSEPSDAGEALDLASAGLRADSEDVEALVAALAVRLEAALPGMVAVKRRRVGGLRSKESAIQAILLSTGDARFELTRAPAGFECTHHTVVRGITVRREQLDLPDWIDEVVAAVIRTASVREQARAALEALIR